VIYLSICDPLSLKIRFLINADQHCKMCICRGKSIYWFISIYRRL